MHVRLIKKSKEAPYREKKKARLFFHSTPDKKARIQTGFLHFEEAEMMRFRALF